MSLIPYIKAGIGIERFSVDVDSDDFGGSGSDTDLAVNIGGGLEFSRVWAELGLGLAGQNISDGLRVRAGYRF